MVFKPPTFVVFKEESVKPSGLQVSVPKRSQLRKSSETYS